MSQLAIGRFVLPFWIIPLLVAVAAGFVAIGIVARGKSAARERAKTIVTNASILYLLAWKLSPLAFETKLVLGQPLMLLYSPGGIPGVALGLGLAGLYVIAAILRTPENRKKVGRLLGVFAGAASIAALSAVGIGSAVTAAGRPEAEVLAPEIELVDMNGRLYRLSDYRGVAVVLNFWASWCPPCRAEIPELNRFASSVDRSRGILLSVNQAASDLPLEQLRTFAAKHGIEYPVLVDARNSAFSAYAIRSIPTTVIVDPAGRVSAKRVGAVTDSWLERQVARAGGSQ